MKPVRPTEIIDLDPVADGVKASTAEDLVWWLNSHWLPMATSVRPSKRRHFKKVEKTAATLRALLVKEAPLMHTRRLEWGALDEALAIVERSARCESHTKPTAPARLEWRDDLVAMVRDAYVEVVKTRGGKAKLLRMTMKILGAVGVEADEREIRRVLKRAPKSPVEILRPA